MKTNKKIAQLKKALREKETEIRILSRLIDTFSNQLWRKMDELNEATLYSCGFKGIKLTASQLRHLFTVASEK